MARQRAAVPLETTTCDRPSREAALSGNVTRDDVFELLAAARFGACVASPDGTVVFWNRRAEQIAGLAAPDVAGRPFREVLDEATARRSGSDPPLAPIPLVGHLRLDRFGQSDNDVLSVYLFDERFAVDSGVPSAPFNRRSAPEAPPVTAPTTPRAAARSVLSRRETEILLLVATGVSTEGIAAQLEISVHTVRNHVRSMRRKLGAKTKLDAVVIAIRQGLLSPDSDFA